MNRIMEKLLLWFVGTIAGLYILFNGMFWLDSYLTGRAGGQVLQGGTFWKALAISFHDATTMERVPVSDIRFKNVDNFLPIDIDAHFNKDPADSIKTAYKRTQGEGIEIDQSSIDSLVIRTQNASHSAIIDDLSFQWGGRGYRIDFDKDVQDNPIPPNTQLLRYELGNLVVKFSADNAVPTVMRGADLTEAVAYYISKFSGPVSTTLLLILLIIPIWLIVRFIMVMTIVLRNMDSPEDIEDQLTEEFLTVGVLALTLGLMGTVIGMIDAFSMLEDTMKVGEGPAQTQLKMAHYINFALITTAVGFVGRVLSLVLLRVIKKKIRTA